MLKRMYCLVREPPANLVLPGTIAIKLVCVCVQCSCTFSWIAHSSVPAETRKNAW